MLESAELVTAVKYERPKRPLHGTVILPYRRFRVATTKLDVFDIYDRVVVPESIRALLKMSSTWPRSSEKCGNTGHLGREDPGRGSA